MNNNDDSYNELSVEKILEASSKSMETMQESYYEFVERYVPLMVENYVDKIYIELVDIAQENILYNTRWRRLFNINGWKKRKYLVDRMLKREDCALDNIFQEFSVLLGKIFGYMNFHINSFNFTYKNRLDIGNTKLIETIHHDIIYDFFQNQIVNYITGNSCELTYEYNDLNLEITVQSNENGVKLIPDNTFNDEVKKLQSNNDLFTVDTKYDSMIRDINNLGWLADMYGPIYDYMETFKRNIALILELVDMCNYSETNTVHISYDMIKLLKKNLDSNEYAELKLDDENDNTSSVGNTSHIKFNKAVLNNVDIDINDIDADDDDTKH